MTAMISHLLKLRIIGKPVVGSAYHITSISCG